MFPVVSASRAAALDAYTIAQGVPSRALMERAGAAAATEIARRYGDRLSRGVLVLAGPGNNGGDGWVIARALAATGVRVHVVEPVEAKTEDARCERALYHRRCHSERSEESSLPSLWPALVVDALLGTGSSGAPRGALADAISQLRAAQDRGATIVAIDLPSGLDATSGDATHAVPADLTLTFGTIKRGQLVARDACGELVLLDIGLLHDGEVDAWLGDARTVRAILPPIGASAHKGTRGKLAIVGGAPGMAGAAILAARAALRSGIGMVKLFVAPESLPAVQEAEPLALAAPWPEQLAEIERELGWAEGVVLGPGLGTSGRVRALAEGVLRTAQKVVLDADGLNLYAGQLEALRALSDDRQLLITPHPAEAARLLGTSVDEVLEQRWDVAGRLARETGACVLLKGVPTLVSDGASLLVSAAGTPTLATAGSGDVLSGIAGTLLVQSGRPPLESALAAAWIHGRAAELLGVSRVRGITLDSVLDALPSVFTESISSPGYPVLVELPRVGER